MEVDRCRFTPKPFLSFFIIFFGGREKANTQQKRLRTVGFLLLVAVGSVQTLCASVYWRESVVGTRSKQI